MPLFKGLAKLLRMSHNTPDNTIQEQVMAEDLIDTKEASLLSGFTESYMRKLVQRGIVKGRKVRRDWLINRESLEQFLASERKVGRPPSSIDKDSK
jgi:hypothetical protein